MAPGVKRGNLGGPVQHSLLTCLTAVIVAGFSRVGQLSLVCQVLCPPQHLSSPPPPPPVEWRSGRAGHLPLQDEDVTTEMVRGWKRVNTLRHYHVPDGATMALSFKQSKNDYVRNVHGMAHTDTHTHRHTQTHTHTHTHTHTCASFEIYDLRRSEPVHVCQGTRFGCMHVRSLPQIFRTKRYCRGTVNSFGLKR